MVWHGFASYLRRRGADAGDLLLLKFDITTGTVLLQLSDDDVLEVVSQELAS